MVVCLCRKCHNKITVGFALPTGCPRCGYLLTEKMIVEESVKCEPPPIKPVDHYPHGHPLNMAVFMALESYSTETFEEGVMLLVKQSKEQAEEIRQLKKRLGE